MTARFSAWAGFGGADKGRFCDDARSCARSSVTYQSSQLYSGYDSSDDDQQLRRLPPGSLDCDWVTCIQQQKKKGKEPELSLPQHVNPNVHWELVAQSFANVMPTAHENHCLVVAGSEVAKGSERFFVVGGCREVVPQSIQRRRPQHRKGVRDAKLIAPNDSEAKRSNLGVSGTTLQSGDNNASPTPRGGKEVRLGSTLQPLVEVQEIPGASLPRSPSRSGAGVETTNSGPTATPMRSRASTRHRASVFKKDIAMSQRVSQGISCFTVQPLKGCGAPVLDPVCGLRPPVAQAPTERMSRQSHDKGPRGPETALLVDWQLTKACMPKKVTSCTACALSGGVRIAVFGGIGIDRGAEPTQDLFIFEVAEGRWRDESAVAGGPPPCFEHAAAAVEGSRTMLVHGGRSSSHILDPPLNHVYCLEVSDRSVSWLPVRASTEGQVAGKKHDLTMSSPPARRAHTMCIEGSGNKRAYLFGGHNESQVTSSLFVLDFDKGFWLEVQEAGAHPVPRAYHTATRLGQYMVVYGGIGLTGVPIQELRLLHLPTLLWSAPSLASQLSGRMGTLGLGLNPSPMDGVQLADMRGNRTSVMNARLLRPGGAPFGTSGGAGPDSWDCPTFTMPSPRSAHAAAPLTCNVREGEVALLIFGGRDGAGDSLMDVHKLVLRLPSTQGEIRSGPDPAAAMNYVAEALLTTVAQEQQEHLKMLRSQDAQQKELLSEIRNLETLAFGAAEEHRRTQESIQMSISRQADLQATLDGEAEQLNIAKAESAARLRTLQIETERLLARVRRHEGDHIREGDLDAACDLEVITEESSESVLNPLTPVGYVHRHVVAWRGGLATSESVPFMRRRLARKATLKSGAMDEREKLHGATPRHISAEVAKAEKQANDQVQMKRIWEEAVKNELRIISFLRHPCLQEVYSAIVQPDGAHIVVEMVRDNLAARLDRGRTMSEEGPLEECDRLDISKDLASALEHLHAKGVAHRHIIMQNAILHRSVGIVAKLGGHLMARVICRVNRRPCVDEALQSVRSAAWTGGVSATASGPEHNHGDIPKRGNATRAHQAAKTALIAGVIDARPIDIRSFGQLLLQLWQPVASQIMKDDDGGRHKFQLEAPALEASDMEEPSQAVGRVRDDSVRLVVSTCLIKDPDAMPSAGAIHLAFRQIQAGDLHRMPTLEKDPTKESPPADIVIQD